MSEFRMPSLGADMDFGTVAAWHIKPGDLVKRGDIIVDVDTQKGVIEVEVWEDGIVDSLLADTGREVAVGTPIAIIRSAGEKPASAPPPAVRLTSESATTAPAPAPPMAAAPAAVKTERPAPARPAAQVSAPVPPAQAPATPLIATGPARGGRLRVSPLARRIAASMGVDLALVHGTGPQGAVTRADVDAAARLKTAEPPAARPAAAPPRHQIDMRQAIAAVMSRSKREIPHYYLKTDIVMDNAMAWLTRINAERPVTDRILPAAMLIKAVAVALEKVPELNGYWLEDGFHPSSAVHVGMAISLRTGGLVAPAIHDVSTKNLAQVMKGLRDLVMRVRAGKIRASEMSDPTVTISNLGDQGVDTVFGVIYPPQVALVGFGRISERPWAEHGMVGARQVMTASLSGDHRASDGHRGGIFLAQLAQIFQEPEKHLGAIDG